MPRIKSNRFEQERLDIKAEIEAAMTKSGNDKQSLSKKTGIPYSTLCVHIKDPDRMTLSELRRIRKVTGLKVMIEAPASEYV